MPSARDILVFVGGALAGGLFVRWYVQNHALELFAEGAGAKVFGESSAITKALGSAGAYVDGLAHG